MRGISTLKERIKREIRRRGAGRSGTFAFFILKPDEPVPETPDEDSFVFVFRGKVGEGH